MVASHCFLYWPELAAARLGDQAVALLRLNWRLSLLYPGATLVAWLGDENGAGRHETARMLHRCGWQVLPGQPERHALDVILGGRPGAAPLFIMDRSRAAALDPRKSSPVWDCAESDGELHRMLGVKRWRPVEIHLDCTLSAELNGLVDPEAPVWKMIYAIGSALGVVTRCCAHHAEASVELSLAGDTVAMERADPGRTAPPAERIRAAVCSAISADPGRADFLLLASGPYLGDLAGEVQEAGSRFFLFTLPGCGLEEDAARRIDGAFPLPSVPVPTPAACRTDLHAAPPARLRVGDGARRMTAPPSFEIGEGLGPALQMLVEGLQQGEMDPDAVSPSSPAQTDPALAGVIAISEQIIRILNEMLGKMPWVSYTLLRGVLSREQRLGGPPYNLAPAQVDEWLNFLIKQRLFLATRETNPVPPGYPVTAIHFNPEHPLTAALLTEAERGRQLLTERIVLTIDEFTGRTGKPWMSMAAIYRSLEYVTRESLKETIEMLLAEGGLTVQTYPNPRGEHNTTGCALIGSHPLVRQALHRRERLTSLLATSEAEWLSLATVCEMLDEAASTSLSWAVVLRDCGVVDLHPRPLPANHAASPVFLRLANGGPAPLSSAC